ncbi:signal transduction histidine kinase [Pedobacter sp. UYP30]|uniref:sensor histidine kinase n=1 Tax=Pedobacter sp. UYP30 TaxID=1756400 RepID=UPI0033974B07
MDILLYLPSQATEITKLIFIATAIFLLVPLFLILYIRSYNQHKKDHIFEKEVLTQKLESEMLKAMVEVQENTMQNIASDLHDNIGQLLSLTSLTLNSIKLSDSEKAQKKIEDSLFILSKTIKDLRSLAKQLHGEQIAQKGLVNIIDQEIALLSKTGVFNLVVKNNIDEIEVPSPEKDLIILRLFQEIINNIIKHAHAKTIDITTRIENGIFYLAVVEDGIGFDISAAKAQKTGMGLNSIERRIELIAGKIIINSGKNNGTKILIEIPYP